MSLLPINENATSTMSDDTPLPFDLPAVRSKKVRASFDSGLISTDEGLVQLREVEHRLCLADLLAERNRDRRGQALITHRLAEMVRVRMFAIASDYKDDDDCGGLSPSFCVIARRPGAAPDRQRLAAGDIHRAGCDPGLHQVLHRRRFWKHREVGAGYGRRRRRAGFDACFDRRRLRNAAAISAVYTPPSRRNRGYAGAVTAALVDRVHAEGKRTACLYTDLRNPFANRCYTKIGFKPVCESWSFARQG